MRFTNTTIDDIPQIQDWIQTDPYHVEQDLPDWWITGNGFLSGCVEDDSGPVFYFRIDKEDDYARLNIQFGPSDRVSKRRVATALTATFPTVKQLVAKEGFDGLVYKSTSQSLIQFVESLGFVHRGDHDFVLRFGG